MRELKTIREQLQALEAAVEAIADRRHGGG